MACLASKDQINAWQCASETTFQLSILPALAGNDSTIMIAVGSSGSNDTVRHGERIPNIPPLELLAINNTEHENDFAYNFRTTYDKIVLLSEDELPLAGEPHVHASTSNTPFQPGDSLWQCIFNETTVEGYIYPTRATTASATNNASGTVDVDNSTTLPDFPYAVELVEEWTPNGKTPYCSKMTMKSDGTLAPLSEENSLRVFIREEQVVD
ncbi:hypothetical protein J4E80_002190 [Alternaria sp. BMP 0032]|nr:hypothetical protein J4E80_002190 [Alternaria sp. BMP 0032]